VCVVAVLQALSSDSSGPSCSGTRRIRSVWMLQRVHSSRCNSSSCATENHTGSSCNLFNCTHCAACIACIACFSCLARTTFSTGFAGFTYATGCSIQQGAARHGVYNGRAASAEDHHNWSHNPSLFNDQAVRGSSKRVCLSNNTIGSSRSS